MKQLVSLVRNSLLHWAVTFTTAFFSLTGVYIVSITDIPMLNASIVLELISSLIETAKPWIESPNKQRQNDEETLD